MNWRIFGKKTGKNLDIPKKSCNFAPKSCLWTKININIHSNLIKEMKKFFNFAMIALVCVGLASCGEEPAAYIQEGPIKLAISNVEATVADLTCTPDDEAAPYFVTWMTKEEFDEFDTYEDMTAAFQEQLDLMIWFYGYFYGETYTYADFAVAGTMTNPMESLTPNTDYVVVAYYMDLTTGEAISTVSAMAFKTPELKEIGKVNVHIVNPEWQNAVEVDGWWQVMGAESVDSTYYVSLSNIETTEVAGTYTLEDMDAEFTFLYDLDKNPTGALTFVDLTVNITEKGSNYVIKADGLAVNGYRYNLTFDEIDKNSGILGPQAPARARAAKAVKAPEVKLNLLKKPVVK